MKNAHALCCVEHLKVAEMEGNIWMTECIWLMSLGSPRLIIHCLECRLLQWFVGFNNHQDSLQTFGEERLGLKS